MSITRYDYGVNTHSGYKQTLLKIENAIILPSGIVLDENWDIIPECLNYCTAYGENIVNEKIDYIKKNNNQIILPNTLEYFNCLNIFNVYPFGHIHDNLQMCKKIEKHNLNKDQLILLKNRTTKHCKDVEYHFNNFGFKNLFTVNFVGNSVDKIDFVKYNVYIIPVLWYSTIETVTSGWCPTLVEWMKSKYPKPENYDKHNRLYLDRNSKGKRSIINNNEVIDLLKSKNFKIVTGSETIREMISLFYDAEFIVFPHGAMGKNIIYCNSKPTILEFCPANRINGCFVGNSHSCGYTHNQIIINDLEDTNMRINIEELKKSLKDI